MDSVTQIVLGAAVGHATAKKTLGRKAALWGAVFGTLPDLDVFYSYGDPVSDFTFHRSATHSLVLMSIAAPVIAALISYWRTRLRKESFQEVFWPWLRLIFLCLTTHALLDAFTVYGTQLLWPITDYPFAIGSIFIIDPLYTIPLLIGLLITLIRQPNTSFSRSANAIGMVLSSAYLLWSVIAQSWVGNSLRSTLQQEHIAYDKTLITPAPFTTFLWRVVAINEHSYYDGYRSIFDDRTNIQLKRFSRNTHLASELPDNWYRNRLDWFSKGFNKYWLHNSQVVMSDLRMGMEPSYVFTFAIGKVSMTDQQLPEERQILPPIQVQQDRDMTLLNSVWRRIWDEQVNMHDMTKTECVDKLTSC